MLSRFCLSVLLVLALPVAMYAQSNAVDAAVQGYVFDASNGAISTAQAVLTNIATGISMQTAADGSGYYRFPLVPVGTYSLTVSATGFEKITQKNVVLNVGQEARLDVTLPVGNATEAVEVQASSEIVDTGTSTIGAVLDRQEVENLPIVAFHLL